MKEVNKDMIIGDILDLDRNLAPILMNSGMHCLGCPSAQGETLEQACEVHGIDADQLVTSMNQFLAQN